MNKKTNEDSLSLISTMVDIYRKDFIKSVNNQMYGNHDRKIPPRNKYVIFKSWLSRKITDVRYWVASKIVGFDIPDDDWY